MIRQNFFNFKFYENMDISNFFVNDTNEEAFNVITNNFDHNIFLFGPSKSGKSHLLNIWIKKFNAILFRNNFKEIIDSKQDIAIDDILYEKSEEEVFHIINHCLSFNLKIFVTSSINLNNYHFKYEDLLSRLRSFYYVKINDPDDEMCKILMTKLFNEKQIIVNNKEIFEFLINRINRNYDEIYLLVDKIDKLSLEKKRQLTIPLIKEIL